MSPKSEIGHKQSRFIMHLHTCSILGADIGSLAVSEFVKLQNEAAIGLGCRGIGSGLERMRSSVSVVASPSLRDLQLSIRPSLK